MVEGRTAAALTSSSRPRAARVYAQVVPVALNYERHLIAPLSARDRATLDRILRVLLGRAVELGPVHAE